MSGLALAAVTRGIPAELAPYLLVRVSGTAYPPPPAGAAEFRRQLESVVRHWKFLAAAAPVLADALYDSADGHPAEFHRKVVLPLRRDVHNLRQPRPALLARLADLPARVPGLRAWLSTVAELAQVRESMAAAAPDALAAERGVLASLCRDEALRRAVTLVGTDLLRGVDRAGAGAAPDARGRKAEPTILRYALRASTKTSPLSWFTSVGWGGWAAPGAGELVESGGVPSASTQANRTLLTRLTDAVLALPRLRSRLRYRVAPGLHVADEVISYRRDNPLSATDRLAAAREEQVDLARSGPLNLLLATAEAAGPAGILLEELTDALAARLPGPGSRAAAATYLAKLVRAGALIPVQPVHPQDLQAVVALAEWLERHGESRLAEALRGIDQQTRRFADLPPGDRVDALADLQDRWRAAFTAADAAPVDAPVLTEDVVLPRPVLLGARHGRVAAADLVGLAALAEVFDFQVLVRRLVRDRFVARYGAGGECRYPPEFAAEISQAWRDSSLVSAAGRIRDADLATLSHFSAEVRHLAELRAALSAAVRGGAEAGAEQVEIPESVIRAAVDVLPDWAAARPSSYSFFVQPARVAGRDRLVLNHIYSGWGKFASRFLSLLDPAAGESVLAQVRRALGRNARVAQLRSVGGFNANLHPLLVDDEIVEDRAWGTIGAEQLWLRHDPDTDQVRLYLEGSRDPIDVLYLGFLIPLALPDRLSPIYSDLGGGPVGLSHLAGVWERDGVRFRPRLTYRDLVVSRRRWQFSAEEAAAMRAALGSDGGPVPAEPVARWRARYELPPDVFIRAPDRSDSPDLAHLREYFYQPKPQYADLSNALHLRCLARTLARHPGAVCLEEALPVPGRAQPGGKVVELMLESYRGFRDLRRGVGTGTGDKFGEE